MRLVAWLAVALGIGAALRFSPEHALLFLGSVFATWFVVPAVARFALRRNATVLPGGRSVHTGRMPLLGGLAVSVPFIAYLLAAGGRLNLGLALGCTLMVLLGAIDDLKGLSPRVKIAGQVAGALLLVGAGYRVPELLLPPFSSLATTGFELLLVVFWVVLVTNAVNLIDGLDGLAATVALVAAIACAVLGLFPAAALVLAGAALGFLRHNLPRARIFLGDSGSLMLGFAVAGFLLNGAGPVNLPLALGILALPLGDVALATARRWLRGKPIFSADRGHVHHRLLDAWSGPGPVLAGLAVFSALLATAAGLWPDLRGLAAAALLWLGALLYLLQQERPRWTRIVLNRRAFRRLHVARHYAAESLRLAEQPAEVAAVMERVAEDFDLASIRLPTVLIERRRDRGAVEVEERVDCGARTASWSAALAPTDPVLAEERRSILCDLLRLADRRIAALGAVPEPPSAPVRSLPEPAPSRRPRVHFIADSRDRLRQIAPFVRETRRRRVLEPVVIYTGRRDDLGLTAAQMRELGLAMPQVDLDVRPASGIAMTARVMERYEALVETARPAVVVVGDSQPCVGCALVAREHGLAVAHVGSGGAAPLPGRVAESLADVTLSARDTGRRLGAGQMLFPVEASQADADAAQLVPALEALLVSAAPPRG